MEDPVKEKPSDSVSGSGVKSKLRYPLRSAIKSKDIKSPAPELPKSSSATRRVRTPSTLSQSVGALELSVNGKPAKPPRRLSIPTKSTTSTASKGVGTITPISETRTKRSATSRGEGRSDTPRPNMSRSIAQRKSVNLLSASYWLAQIKLSESALKHMISLGFFKLAVEAGCEPIQQMREELKSYLSRHKLDEHADVVKGLLEIYNVSESPQHAQVSESCSQVPGSETRSSSEEVQNVSSSARGNIKMEPKSSDSDTTRASSALRSAAKDKATRKKTATPVTRSSLNKSFANSRKISETVGRETQKKAESVAKPEPNRAKQKMNKQEKKPYHEAGSACPPAGEIIVDEDKENVDAPAVEQAGSAQV